MGTGKLRITTSKNAVRFPVGKRMLYVILWFSLRFHVFHIIFDGMTLTGDAAL